MIGLLQLFQLFIIDRLAALAPKLGLKVVRVDDKGNAIGPWDMKDEDVEVAPQPTIMGQGSTMVRPNEAQVQAAAVSDPWEEQMRQNEARYWEISRNLTARQTAWWASLSPEEQARIEARRALRIADPRAYREAKEAEFAAWKATLSPERQAEVEARRALRIANPRAYSELKRAEFAAWKASLSPEERQDFDERRAARWNRRRETMAAWERRWDELEQQMG